MAYHRDLKQHPGIESIQTIMAYFKLHRIRARLIGTQFRKVSG
jgi:transaldolase